MIRKSTNVIKLWKTFIPSAIVAMLIGCGKKDGNKDAIYDVDNYPVAEISEGLAQAAQTFSEVFEFHDSLAIVKGGSYYGVIDRNGNLVIPCEYNNLERCGKVFYAEKWRREWGVIDREGKELVPCRYDKYEEEVTVYPEDEIIRYIEEDSSGYGIFFKDFNGKKLFDKGLSAIRGKVSFHEGLSPAAISSESYRWYGYIDKTGKTIINPRYEEPATFFNGLAMVTEYKSPTDHPVYFIDKQGNEVMKVVKKNNLYGVVDAFGAEVVPCRFKSIDCYDSGLLLTTGVNNLNGVWSVKDKKEIVAPMYDIVPTNNEILGCKTFVENGGIIIVKKDDSYGAINTDGNEIVPCIFNYACVEKGFIEVKRGTGPFISKKGAYDREGNEILKCEHSILEIEENSIIGDDVDIEGDELSMGHVLVDRNGNTITKVGTFGQIRHISEGLAAVAKDDTHKFGFYDYDDDEVIEPRYEDAKTFSEGLAPVKFNGRWGYVNRKGVDTFGNK